LVDDSSFEKEVLKEKLPVLVDFAADWCPPCRAIAPILDELSDKYRGRMKMCRVDIEKSPDLAVKYGVMSIPMLIIFHNGVPLGGRAGATDAETLTATIEMYLKKISAKVKKKMPRVDHVEL